MTDVVHLLKFLLGICSGDLLEWKETEKKSDIKKAFERNFITVPHVNLLSTHVVMPDKGS